MKHTLLRLGWITWLGLFLACGAFGQISGSITSNQCVSVDVSQTGSTVGIQVTGTWSGTLQPQITIQGQSPVNTVVTPVGSTTTQSTITANGGFTAAVAGASTFQVCGNTVSSGTAAVFLNRSQASVKGSGGGTFVGAKGKPYIDGIDYGVVGEGHFAFLFTGTSGTSVINCPACNFNTNATVGQIVYASNLTALGFSTSTVIKLPQGTISQINSNTQITVSTTFADTTCQVSGNCFLVWGTDETTQLQNAWTAVLNSCSTLNLTGVNPEGTGPGVILVTSGPVWANPSALCQGTGGVRSGVGIQGQGFDSTYIMPTPSFASTGCTAGASGNACFAITTDGGHIRQFTIHGGGNSQPGAGFTTKIGLEIDSLNNAYANDIQLLFWGGNSSLSLGTGLELRGGEIITYNVGEDGFGGVGRRYVSNGNLGPTTEVEPGSYDNGFANFYDNNSANPVFTIGGNYGAGGNTFACINNSAIWHSTGDTFGLATGQGTAISGNGIQLGSCLDYSGTVTGAGTMYMSQDLLYATPSAGHGVLYTQASNITLQASQSQFVNLGASATSDVFFNNGNIFDNGGNTFTKGSGRFLDTSSTGTSFGTNSITGTTITAGAAVLSAGWGTTAAWSALAGNNSFNGTITASGTGQLANPTITYTFPVAYVYAPPTCIAFQVGGTQAQGTFATSSLTTTGVVFTYSGTPGAANTVFVQVECR